ncbi:MAG: hypothetical protein KatS3mg087_1249 [Patescibacteria group bacterium]|nr:MAG: hypothetical protein KatS3mg087_1249 [Patescibacteria group bacterium]
MTDFGETPQPSDADIKIRDPLEEALKELKLGVKLTRRPTEHIHKNDEDYGSILMLITPDMVSSNRRRVGMIVGNGAILSSLPDIPAETLIVTDYNPFIHEWTEYTQKMLSEASSPEDYRIRVYSDQNPLYTELTKLSLKPEQGLEEEMKDLGAKHFLTSPQRFSQCKLALLDKKIISMTVNLTDAESLSRLRVTLEGENAEITFANFTNVWEHAGDSLATAIPNLPINENAIILHSSRAYTERGNPKMMGICRGVDAYINIARPSNSFWRQYRQQGRRY